MPSALLLILGGDIPALVAVPPASAAAAKSAYAMTVLGTGEEASINDVGQIAGNSGTITDLATRGGIQSAAYAINDNGNDKGQIVASGSSARGQEHAFLLTSSE